MATAKSIELSGRDLYAVLAANMIYWDVPFTMTKKRRLSAEEQAASERLQERASSARDSLVPRPVGQWTATDRQQMLSRTVEFEFGESEIALLAELLRRCLAEFGSESSIRPFLNPGIGRRDLESLSARLDGTR
jgi:hypothetical protein